MFAVWLSASCNSSSDRNDGILKRVKTIWLSPWVKMSISTFRCLGSALQFQTIALTSIFLSQAFKSTSLSVPSNSCIGSTLQSISNNTHQVWSLFVIDKGVLKEFLGPCYERLDFNEFTHNFKDWPIYFFSLVIIPFFIV